MTEAETGAELPQRPGDEASTGDVPRLLEGALAETERNAAEARRWYEVSLRLAEETGVEPAAERARAALGRLR